MKGTLYVTQNQRRDESTVIRTGSKRLEFASTGANANFVVFDRIGSQNQSCEFAAELPCYVAEGTQDHVTLINLDVSLTAFFQAQGVSCCRYSGGSRGERPPLSL